MNKSSETVVPGSIDPSNPNDLIVLGETGGLQPLGGFVLNPADIEPGKQFHQAIQKGISKPQTVPATDIFPS